MTLFQCSLEKSHKTGLTVYRCGEFNIEEIRVPL